MADVKILIPFYSRTGTLEALAKAVAEGARAEGAEVRLRRAREVVSPEVMQSVPGWADSAARMNGLYEAPNTEPALPFSPPRNQIPPRPSI